MKQSYGKRLCKLALRLGDMVDEPNKSVERTKFPLRSLARFNKLLEKKEALSLFDPSRPMARHRTSTNLPVLVPAETDDLGREKPEVEEARESTQSTGLSESREIGGHIGNSCGGQSLSKHETASWRSAVADKVYAMSEPSNTSFATSTGRMRVL